MCRCRQFTYIDSFVVIISHILQLCAPTYMGISYTYATAHSYYILIFAACVKLFYGVVLHLYYIYPYVLPHSFCILPSHIAQFLSYTSASCDLCYGSCAFHHTQVSYILYVLLHVAIMAYLATFVKALV